MVKYGIAPVPAQPIAPREEETCVSYHPTCDMGHHSHKCCAFCELLQKCRARCDKSWTLTTLPSPTRLETFQCRNMKTIPEFVWSEILAHGGDVY